MPQDASTQQTQQQTQETQATGQPPSAQATGQAAAEFRIGDDAPEYLRGKTQAEVIDWTTKLVNEVQQVLQRQQVAPPTQQRTMEQTQQTLLPDPDEALTDPKGYQSKMAAYFNAQTQAQIAATAQPFAAQLADTARSLNKMDPKNADVWKRWGSEVDTMVQAMPAHLRTQALYDNAIVMVQGRHWQELAAEKAATLAAASPQTEHVSADDGSTVDIGSADVWEKIGASPIGKATLDAIGKKGIIRAVNSGVYKSLDAYAEAVTKSKSRTEAQQKQVIRG